MLRSRKNKLVWGLADQLIDAQKVIAERDREIDQLKRLVIAYRDKKVAKLLLDEAVPVCSTFERGLLCHKLLEQTVADTNYRDYIVQDQNGRIVIDPLQVFRSDEEIRAMLAGRKRE